MGPSEASTSKTTPSTMDKIRSTSPPKSAWPGVSTMLIWVPCQLTEVHFDKMVMPLSRSRSLLSITQVSTFWLSRKVPLCFKSPSTIVVLPWSTWAIMAIFLKFIYFCSLGYLRFSDIQKLTRSSILRRSFMCCPLFFLYKIHPLTYQFKIKIQGFRANFFVFFNHLLKALCQHIKHIKNYLRYFVYYVKKNMPYGTGFYDYVFCGLGTCLA